jgi:hypothetical protein
VALAAGLFSGASIYINWVEHPVGAPLSFFEGGAFSAPLNLHCGYRWFIAYPTFEKYDGAVMMLEMLATLAAGLFSGASIYINLVEHPARMQCGTAPAVAQWAPNYQRATVMQASLGAIGCLSATGAWLLGAAGTWLVGGILLGLVIPFTLIVILATNRKLLSPDLVKESPDTRRLLDRWARLHAVRSLLSFSSFVVFLLLLTKNLS